MEQRRGIFTFKLKDKILTEELTSLNSKIGI